MIRYDAINHIINEFNYKTYLEIGVKQGDTFNKISKNVLKESVDINGEWSPTYHCSSDDFFKELPLTKKWDIIFIDGYHEKEQVKIDIENSLLHLNSGGCIVCHDTLPAYPHYLKPDMCHNAWEAIFEIRQEKDNLKILTIDSGDDGLTIIRRGYESPLEENKYKKEDRSFDFLHKNKREIMNYVTHQEFIEAIKYRPKIQVGIPCFSYEGDCENYIDFAIQSMIMTAKNPEDIEFVVGLNGGKININKMKRMKNKCFGIKFIDVIEESGKKERIGDAPHKTEHTEDSLNHGEVLDILFEHFDSFYGMWIDADIAFISRGWDEKLKNELNEKCPIVGMTYPKNRNRYENFPTIMTCMFITNTLKDLGISFSTTHMGGSRERPVTEEESKWFNLPVGSSVNMDTGEMLPLIQKEGYTGKCIHSVHLFQKDGELQFLDDDIDVARRTSGIKNGNGKVCEAQMNGEVIFTHLSESRYRKYNEDSLSKVWLKKIQTWLKEKYGEDIVI
jgi:hypothetical protein